MRSSRKPGDRPDPSNGKRWMLGLGLDGNDGHLRCTKGQNFRLVGGSEDTHGEMQEKVIHFNEELSRRNMTLDQISKPEFDDIARETGLKQD